MHKLVLKFGPLRAERIVKIRDGADLERLISQADALLGLDMPDLIWRELKVTATPLPKTQWFEGMPCLKKTKTSKRSRVGR
jgi:hypothetical protein